MNNPPLPVSATFIRCVSGNAYFGVWYQVLSDLKILLTVSTDSNNIKVKGEKTALNMHQHEVYAIDSINLNVKLD